MSQSTIRLVEFNDSGDGMVFVLEAANIEQIADEVTGYFKSRGYRLEAGTALDGTWGSGNAVLRALFGAMAKRYKFNLNTEGDPSRTTLRVSSAMSGAGGGLVGHGQMKKEAVAIGQGLKALFGSEPALQT